MKYPRTRKQIILYKRLVQYCKQLGVKDIPLIAWNKIEEKELFGSKRKASSNRLGHCSQVENKIYIAYNAHRGSLVHLDHTLRHELIHYRFTGVAHGVSFEKKIKELKQGKTWKEFDRNAWVKARDLKWKTESMEWSFRSFIYQTQHTLKKLHGCNCWYCMKARQNDELEYLRERKNE